MKTKIFLSSLLAVSLFMVSCKKELQPQESSTPTEAPVTDVANGQAPTPQPMNLPTQQQPAVQQQIQPQTTTTAPGMNPPHGQPNHRCDIAVGAPLNSPPGQKPAQATPNPVQAQPQPQVQPQTVAATAPGMNPPHGQPNHRCDVAVGAPLPK
jgi:hypothetical protein